AGGTLTINGSLSADGKGENGNGGSITLAMKTSKDFIIGDQVNGGVGSLSAGVSLGTGSGGTIAVTQNGSGGIQVLDTNALQIVSNQGDGGGLGLSAKQGTVKIAGGTIDVSAMNSAGGKGGSIIIEANSLKVDGSVPLKLMAEGG